jgi:hypothetical protein
LCLKRLDLRVSDPNIPRDGKIVVGAHLHRARMRSLASQCVAKPMFFPTTEHALLYSPLQEIRLAIAVHGKTNAQLFIEVLHCIPLGKRRRRKKSHLKFPFPAMQHLPKEPIQKTRIIK